MNLLTGFLLIYAGAGVLAGLKFFRYSRWLLIMALIGHGCLLGAGALHCGHLPIFTLPETLSVSALLLGCLALVFGWRYPGQSAVQPWALLLIVLLLGAAILQPPPPACFDYNHSYTYAVAFHLFRRLALGLTLFASVLFFNALLQAGPAPHSAAQLRYQGRNAIMAAVLMYMLGEDVGIIWCLQGWGDVWHWSPTFALSTMVLVYLMLALHLPGGSRRPGFSYSLVGLSCGPLMLLAQFFKS
ncbi:MAG: hypothetical protein JXR80_10675 [Deltaproteobacteria bacterium]|nr:hypothetical protein [Deltaproteobacteria bacterium]